MAKKLMSWKTKGMNRDFSVSAFNPEFAFENRNLRLGTNDANTVLSWVNERGTLSLPLKNIEYWSKVIPNTEGYVRIVYEDPNDSSWTHHEKGTEEVFIEGTPIGTAVINHKLVVFTTDTLRSHDYIYVLWYTDESKESLFCKLLFGNEGASLGFDIDHPLKTIVSYESEYIQKIYWTDGKNQPRVINIEGRILGSNTTQFDFVPTLQLQEHIYVKKLLGAHGIFAPGVIQYAFTYYKKNGQESNVFYVSPLLYISHRDRGASPEDRVKNAFQITVVGIDNNFDYLRIYSIHRTSIDSTPICKRVQDIAISGLEENSDGLLQTMYTDTGTSGDSIDPTELLYKGGEIISAFAIEQKDNTLFLGNISITRPEIEATMADSIKANTQVSQSTRDIKVTAVSTGTYVYANQLTAFTTNGLKSVPCAGFKYGDVYRLGLQFQYKTGKWSDPIWVKDVEITNRPSHSDDNQTVTLPTLKGNLSSADAVTLIAKGYRRVRPLVVFPTIQDRKVLCQGVVNKTLAQFSNIRSLAAQSSWFFRPSSGGKHASDGTGIPASEYYLPYANKRIDRASYFVDQPYNPLSDDNYLKLVEIQGDFDESNKFYMESNYVTFHSPDVEFDDQLSYSDYSNSSFRQVGHAVFTGTMSDIDIQTESPTVSNEGSGFVHKSFNKMGPYGIVSGLFYDDYLVDDADTNVLKAWPTEKSPCKWMVYTWNGKGSLNNDINRPAETGNPTAILKKKVISNLRYSKTDFISSNSNKRSFEAFGFPQLFSSDEVSILKLGDNIYKGNIDTVLIPDNIDGCYFAFEGSDIGSITTVNVNTPFESTNIWKTFSKKDDESTANGIYHWESSSWQPKDYAIGDDFVDLVMKKKPVSMKYKSTPHLVFKQSGKVRWSDAGFDNSLPIIEILNEPFSSTNSSVNTRFGGDSIDALRANIWIPCGEPVLLSDYKEKGVVTFNWEYGDTYFQRWDCLKTYAFTTEDTNQVVEIGSFMLETRVNIDGRYDRNRGQMNNLNMSPRNFNLLNPVYSQTDNFFQYRIQDKDYYRNMHYPNQITWSKTKQNGTDVDLWTNVTLASILEMDGDKGKISSLNRLNNQLICFQDRGIAQILYNDNVQIQSTAGVPIEIANSGKVNGKDYKSDTIGCSNSWSICAGASGLYFMDSEGKDIYVFNGQLVNISNTLGFNSWSKLNIPSGNTIWNPIFTKTGEKSAFVTYYDKINQEIYFINKDKCLAFSERFNVFTSFYDYDGTPFFCNLEDTEIWIKVNTLWKHQAGDYCNFFGVSKPYSTILIGNPEPQTDKIFTNLEFRACVDGDGETDADTGRFTPFTPFDSLETWNEYQYGIAYLSDKIGHTSMQHHTRDNESSLKRKFRIWRCDIPRDNGDILDTFDETFDDTFHPLSRTSKHPLDRMRNPWLYLKLRKYNGTNKRTEIHDLVMTYYS